MPHRPTSGVGPSSSSAAYTRINGLSEEAASKIIRYPQQAGVVTPLSKSQQWVSSHQPSLGCMRPTLENLKSSDSVDRSVATKHDDSTVATLTTELSADEMEKRENIASALLLVSTAAVRHCNLTEIKEDISALSTGPLKKRPKHIDFRRRDSEDEQPCHISPVSHESVEGRTVSHEESTPQRPGRLGPQAARSHSYDSKDSPHYQTDSTQELPDSAKIHNAQDIAVPSQVIIPHFPTVLHRVLADQQLAGSVLTWLPDGESWKVLRWDALRREVLPQYFSTLRDENGSGCGTIDAFLYHLTAWGFEEVRDGSAVGAYRHDLFIRGAQKLSNKMRFTGAPGDHQGSNILSSAQAFEGEGRALLQVPTLARDAIVPSKRPRHEEQLSHPGSIRRPSPGPVSWPMGGYHQHSEDSYTESHTWGHPYSDRTNNMFPGSAYNDPRFGLSRQRQVEQTYAPPQVRSGRGAMRVSGISRPATAPVVTPSQPGRTSFPVSNRGKGRKLGAVRMPDSNSEEAIPIGSSSASYTSMSMEEAERVGSSVKGLAVAVSRKTKRKLPLARKPDQQPTASTAVEHA